MNQTDLGKRASQEASGVWERLTRPAPAITDPEAIRQVRGLAGTTLAFMPMMLLVTFISLPLGLAGLRDARLATSPLFYLGTSVTLLTLVSYLLSRTRAYRVGGVIFLVSVLAAIYLGAIVGNVDLAGRLLILHWLTFAVLLASFFMNTRLTALLGALSALSLLLLPRIVPELTFSSLIGVITFVGGFSFAIVVIERQRDALEADRRRLLVNYQAELETQVAARTFELADANRRLESLGRVKDEFVSNVSHELRTPITSIKLNHHLLATEPKKLAEVMPTLERETQRLERIVEALLQLSRMDQKEIGFKPAPTDLNRIVEQIVQDRQPIAHSKNLTLAARYQKNIPPAMADPELLAQALSILLTNAVNYTPPGGAITIATAVRQVDHSELVGFSVADTGPGIPAEEQPHLFERFFRGQAARLSGVEGTGLGLAIASKIVEWHAGRIEVASEGVPGEGAIFHIWLPAAKAMQDAAS